MAKPKLTNADYCRASKRLKVEPAVIKAVASVESAGNGFLPDGRVILLFERHHFAKLTRNKFNRSHPQISSTKAGGYYGKEREYQRFNVAFALDPEAAMKATSWGKFQILGSNHAVCGFSTVGKFVDAMKVSEGKQLDAFCGFVEGNNLTRHLRSLDWKSFARGYNGPAYAKNKYDTKMATAYRKYAKENIDCTDSPLPAEKPAKIATTELAIEQGGSNQTTASEGAIDQNGAAGEITAKRETDTATGTETVEAKTLNEQPVTDTAAVPEPTAYRGVGFWASIKKDLIAATGGNLGFESLSQYAQQASGWPEWVIAITGKLAVGVLIATLGYFLFRVVHYFVDRLQQNARTKLLAEINSDVTRKDIVLVPQQDPAHTGGVTPK